MRLSNCICIVVMGSLACAPDKTSSGADADAATELEVVASLGGADEMRPEYEFGRITGLALLANGRVAVADVLGDVVRIYDPTGAHVVSFGRRGAGPGEFSGVCCVAQNADGAVWVRDGGNGRYGVFDLGGDSIAWRGLVRMAHSDANRHAPLTFDSEGNVIDIGMRADATTGQHRPYRMHLDAEGRVVAQQPLHQPPDDSTAMKSVQRPVDGGTMTMYAYQPFGPMTLTAHSPTGEYAHALSSRYAIDWRAADGSLIRHIANTPAAGPALSDAERRSADDDLTATAQRLGIGRPQLGFDVPARKNPLRNLWFDGDGRLWAELEVADGARRSAHVYDRDGAHVRTVGWPADVWLSHGAIRGDNVWGVRRDSLGVQSVVRLGAAAR